jgi:hypothetical protein
MAIIFLSLKGNDLDSIRALFSEKEKELSLAVAKVEALTRQLEELRKDRRGLNILNNNGNVHPASSPAARELEKLRRELMVFILIHLNVKSNFTSFSFKVSQSTFATTRRASSITT